jgi:hypothetical protein
MTQLSHSPTEERNKNGKRIFAVRSAAISSAGDVETCDFLERVVIQWRDEAGGK